MSTTTIILIVVAVGVMFLMHTVGHGGHRDRDRDDRSDGTEVSDRIGAGDSEPDDGANINTRDSTDSGHAGHGGHRGHGCC